MISLELKQKILALLPDKDLLNKYPVWRELEGWDESLTYDHAIVFITATYHPKSPICQIESFTRRRYEAAILADFPTNENKIHNHTDILTATNPFFNKLVLSYLRLFNSPMYEAAMIYRDELAKELESLNTLVEDNAKLKADARKTMLQNIKEITARLQECALEFLQGDKSRELLMSFYEDLEINTLGLIIEDVALNLKEGRRPLGNHCNPYDRSL